MIGRMIIPAALHRDRNSGWVATRNTTPLFDDDLDVTAREITKERRSSRRFPIELPGEVHTRKSCVHGMTVNLSSGGLLMYCADGILKIGERVTVRLANWPGARLDMGVALIVEGIVVRSSAGYIAVRRKRYAFARA